MSPKGAKGLSELGRVSRLFGQRYCNNSSSVAWTKESLQRMMDSIIIYDRPDGAIMGQNGNFAVPVNAREVVKPKPGIGLYKPRPPKNDEGMIRIHEFFNDLRNILEIETKEMSFDYFLMHRVCWKLLRRINELCRPQITQLYGAGYLPKEHFLPLIPEFIFETIATSPPPGDGGLRMPNPLLVSTAKAFEELFEVEADAVIRRSSRLGIELDIEIPM